MPIDSSIPLQFQQQPDNFGKLMQVGQMQQMGQQRQQQEQQLAAQQREARRIKEMANRGAGLFMRYQSLKDQGFSEQAAHAAMQEDWQREIGGLASVRFDDGSPLFDQNELGQMGQEFNAGQLGMILPKLMGADKALDLHFKNLEASDKRAGRKFQADTLAETRRHNQAMEGRQPAGARPVPVADPKSPTGFTYQTPEGSVGQPAPAPRATNSTRYSAKELENARGKMRLIQTAKQQLQDIKNAREKLRGAWSMGGPGGMLPTEAGSNFDGAVDSFRSTVEGLTRTPGIGAQSDFEARLNQAKLPSRKEYESTADQKIKSLESLINGLEAGYGDLLNDGGPEAVPTVGQEVDDILGAADAILEGQ